MSSTDVQSRYDFTVTTTQTATSNYDQGSWTAYSSNGMTDELASLIVKSINNVTPPTGMTVRATVAKYTVTSVNFSTDYTTTPVTFS